MDWKDTIKGVAKAAKDTAEGVSGLLIAEVWPLLQPELLMLAARLQQDVRNGTVQANEEVRAFFKDRAAPTVAQILSDDDTFDLVAELAYDSLPAPVRRRVKRRQVVEFCRRQRDALLAALAGGPKPAPAPKPKLLPPPSDER